MDKLEIKQGSFIPQTQYFIPVEIDLSVVPARLGIWFFHLSHRTTVMQDLLVQRYVFTGIGQTLMSRPVAMLLLGRLITHMATWRRGGKSISVSGNRGDSAITKNKRKKKWHVSDFLTVGGSSNCLKSGEEPHKFFV